MHTRCSQHDKGHAVLGDIAVFADTTTRKERNFVLSALLHQIQVAVAQIGGNGVACGIHAHVIGRASTAIDAVDQEAACIGVAHQIVEHRLGRGAARDLRIDRHPEAKGHGHGLDHLHDAFLNGVERLVHGWRGQINSLGHAAQPGNELTHLEPHQQAAIAGLGPLAVLDFNGRRVTLHLGDGADDFIPTKVARGNLQDDVLKKRAA